MDKLSDILNHGYGSMWLVVAFSVIAIAVAVERLIVQWKFSERARDLAQTVNRELASNSTTAIRSACERSQSPTADIYLAGLAALDRNKSNEVTVATVHRERIRVASSLRTRLWMLGTIGATAPFVGLFGTVVGIMEAMGRFKGEETVKFAMVSGPISEALIVTAAGILVAVEAVILFNYFSQRSNRIGAEMKLLTDEFLENLLDPVATQAGHKEAQGGSDGDRRAAK